MGAQASPPAGNKRCGRSPLPFEHARHGITNVGAVRELSCPYAAALGYIIKTYSRPEGKAMYHRGL